MVEMRHGDHSELQYQRTTLSALGEVYLKDMHVNWFEKGKELQAPTKRVSGKKQPRFASSFAQLPGQLQRAKLRISVAGSQKQVQCGL
jgi:hypothetical protein